MKRSCVAWLKVLPAKSRLCRLSGSAEDQLSGLTGQGQCVAVDLIALSSPQQIEESGFLGTQRRSAGHFG